MSNEVSPLSATRSADPHLSPRRRTIIIAGLITAMVLGALDQSVVNTALPRMASDLGGLAHLSWVVTAFMLTSTIATPLYGKLSDMYGRRPLFVASIAIFLTASILCGVAQSMGQLIAFRALQGIGGGGLMTLAQTVIADIVPPRERGRFQGFFTGTFAVSSVAGPLIGGALTSAFSWRWVFYINIPLCLLALVLLLSGLRPLGSRTKHRIDYAGSALMALASGTALLLFTAAGSAFSWASPQAGGLAALSLAATALFIWQERRAAEPLIDLGLFRLRSFTVGVLTMSAMGFAMMSAMVFLPLYFQLVLGLSPAGSGFMLLPQVAAMLITSIGGGILSSRFGHPKPLMVAGIAGEAAGLAGLAVLALAKAGIPAFLLDLAVLGLGMGIAMPNATALVQNGIPRNAMGVATASMSFIRSLGGASGVAISAGVMAAHLTRNLAGIAGGLNIQALLDGNLSELNALPAATHTAVVSAYQHAIAYSFLIGGGVMALAVLLSATLRNVEIAENA